MRFAYSDLLTNRLNSRCLSVRVLSVNGEGLDTVGAVTVAGGNLCLCHVGMVEAVADVADAATTRNYSSRS